MGIDFRDVTNLARKFQRFPREYEKERQRNDGHFGQLLLERVQLKASGRPGPNVITGEYRGSFQIFQTRTRVGVYTFAPQANRLERGFSGTDSRGRTYNQPPFPHMLPALLEVKEEYKVSQAEIVRRAWRNS